MILTAMIITGLGLFVLGIADVFVLGYTQGVQAATVKAWTRVEDGLPSFDDYDWVLAYVHINDKIDNFAIIASYENGEWRRDVDYAKLSDLGMTVTHWMPLSEGPKEENQIIVEV